jgi:hypothetical protein
VDRLARAGGVLAAVHHVHGTKGVKTFMDELDISPRGELERLRTDRDEYVEEIKGLCAEVGIYNYDPLPEDRIARLERLRTHDGRVLPPNLKGWITRTLQRLELVLTMIAEIEADQAEGQ